MAAFVDGSQFHRPLEAQLDTVNTKNQVQYDKRKPELWEQFWNRAQAPFDDAGLLGTVVKGKPNGDDLAAISSYIEFEGAGRWPERTGAARARAGGWRSSTLTTAALEACAECTWRAQKRAPPL